MATSTSTISTITRRVKTDDSISIKDMLMICLRYWPWFVLSVGVIMGAVTLYLLSTPKIYTRTASILVKSGSSKRNSEMRMYEELGQLKARYGVFAILGNHDYYANNEKSEQLIKKAGIRLLKDEAVLVDNAFYVVGRDDRANDMNRKSLNELTKDLDHSKPILLMDHQPYHLDRTEAAGIDFQLSGHTHRGQIFPINLVTDRVYEKSHGYLRKGNSHIYVTSGIGLWGGKFRIGTQSEYLVMEMAGR